MHDDVGPVVKGSHQVRGGQGGVDDERHPGVVRHLSHPGNVEHIGARIAQHLTEQRLRRRLNGRTPLVQIVRILHERGGDTQSGQGVFEQVLGAAVQRSRHHNMVPRPGHVEDRQGSGRLPRGEQYRAHPTLERGDLVLDGVGGRVGQARVDGAELLQGETSRGRFGGREAERRRLVDRQLGGSRGGIVGDPGVDLLGLEQPVC